MKNDMVRPGGYCQELSSLEKNDEISRLQYILNFCELISDLCKERNFQAMRFAQQKFPKQVLLKVVTSNQYSFRVREVLLNLFGNLWMDRQPY